MKIQTSVRRQQSWRLRTRAGSVGRRRTNLAPFQTGWHSCIECGRYAELTRSSTSTTETLQVPCLRSASGAHSPLRSLTAGSTSSC
jgi:hypothetical protein